MIAALVLLLASQTADADPPDPLQAEVDALLSESAPQDTGPAAHVPATVLPPLSMQIAAIPDVVWAYGITGRSDRAPNRLDLRGLELSFAGAADPFVQGFVAAGFEWEGTEFRFGLEE